jgi:type IV pilus assembly protein PilA
MTPRPNELDSHHRRGFAAVELVLVLAATSIVVALGISIYRTHSVRAQVAASLEETEPAQRLVAAAFRDRGTPPFDAAATGIDDTTQHFLGGTYVESLAVSNGRIDVRFGSRADRAIVGKTLSLTPFETADHEIVWICGNERPGVGIKPLGFAGGALQSVQVATAIESRFLPTSCR